MWSPIQRCAREQCVVCSPDMHFGRGGISCEPSGVHSRRQGSGEESVIASSRVSSRILTYLSTAWKSAVIQRCLKCTASKMMLGGSPLMLRICSGGLHALMKPRLVTSVESQEARGLTASWGN